jgi:hypothetical protein
MRNIYQIPKVRVPVEVRFRGEDPAPLDMFVGKICGHHDGPERPSEVLNGDQEFIPMVSPEGEPVIVRREAVIEVIVDAAHEGERPSGMGLGQVASAEVRIDLEDGPRVQGTFEYLMPEDRCRLQDFLNTGQRFLPLRDGPRVRLINSRFIRRVLPLVREHVS